MNSNKVLIVDEERFLCSTLEFIISSAGHEVIVCNNGLEAFNIFSQAVKTGKPFDLVITELLLPGLMGIDLIRKAVELDPFIPIIITTSQSELQNTEMDSLVGSWEFLFKPFEKQKMIDAIRRAFQKRDVLREELHKYQVINSLIKLEKKSKNRKE